MPPPATDNKSPVKRNTKIRIMEAAEQLFAAKGFDATSMRDITKAAGVNLASVNYHFGSKEALISAIFSRHLGSLNAARIELLDIVEEKAGDGPLSIEAVLEAFIYPVVDYHLTLSAEKEAFMRLIGRCLSEPPTHFEQIKPHFDGLIERFNAAVARALPDLSSDEAFWRLHFTIGTVHHTLHMLSCVEKLPNRPSESMDTKSLAKRLVAFTAAGMKSRLIDVEPLNGQNDESNSLRSSNMTQPTTGRFSE
jgi:AcrR family transcriptional regulator